MLKKTIGLAIFLSMLCGAAWGIAPNQVVRPQRVERLHQLLQKLGPGEDSLVAVRMNDKTAVAGYVQEIEPDSFTVVDRKSGETVKVSLYKIDKLQGFNIVSGTEVHHGTGIRAKLARVALKIFPVHQTPVNSLTGGEKTLLIGIIIGVLLAIVLAKVL